MTSAMTRSGTIAFSTSSKRERCRAFADLTWNIEVWRVEVLSRRPVPLSLSGHFASLDDSSPRRLFKEKEHGLVKDLLTAYAHELTHMPPGEEHESDLAEDVEVGDVESVLKVRHGQVSCKVSLDVVLPCVERVSAELDPHLSGRVVCPGHGGGYEWIELLLLLLLWHLLRVSLESSRTGMLL